MKNFIHQGFEYFIASNGNCVFPEQPFPIKPEVIMAATVLEPNDTICFYKGVNWLWKNSKFIITSGHEPWIFAWKDEDGVICGIKHW